MTMPCVPVGVGMTCRSLLHAAAVSGFKIDLTTSRYDDRSNEAFALREARLQMLNRLPYAIGKHIREAVLHRRFLSDIHPGEIAYLWPSVPLAVFEQLARRGTTILTEAINTRMAVARPILDAAYDRLGLPPSHGITDARIAEQEARHALASAIFAPSPATENAFPQPYRTTRVISSSYGTWVPQRLPARAPRKIGQPVTFLFVGSLGVRKGAHALLQAWKRAPANARLRIVGPIEVPIRKIFGDVLNLPSVTSAGFLRDVGPEYRAADVFILPSLEEGDPIVTYEAAAHGLPVLATGVGAGRIGADTGCVFPIDASDPEELTARINDFSRSSDLRDEWGTRARAAARAYDWSVVAPRRFAALSEFLSRSGAA